MQCQTFTLTQESASLTCFQKVKKLIKILWFIRKKKELRGKKTKHKGENVHLTETVENKH